MYKNHEASNDQTSNMTYICGEEIKITFSA